MCVYVSCVVCEYDCVGGVCVCAHCEYVVHAHECVGMSNHECMGGGQGKRSSIFLFHSHPIT